MKVYTPTDLKAFLHRYDIDWTKFVGAPITSIHDPNRDDDDAACAPLMFQSTLLGAEFLGLIGNRKSSRRRSEASRDILDSLGLWFIPTIQGSDIGEGDGDIPHDEYTLAMRHFGTMNCVRGDILGSTQMFDIGFKPRSTALVCSAWTDLARLIAERPEQAAKLGKVVAMSGVELDDKDCVKRNAQGRMIASTRASNNNFDQGSADLCIDWFQSQGVPLQIVTRELVYTPELRFPGNIYHRLAETEHRLGKFLKEFQWKILEHIWHTWLLSPNIPVELAERMEDGLKDYHNRDLWNKIFLRPESVEKYASRTILDPFPNPDHFVLYDLYTLALCFDAIRERFGNPEIVQVRAESGRLVDHYLYRSPAHVKDPELFCRFLQQALVWSLKRAM